MTENGQETRAGYAIDQSGAPVIDPTKNVLDLVSAAIARQDDLRILSEKSLRNEANLRAEHARELRVLEAARIDAIRAVDVAATAAAAQVQEARASVLANTVALSADAMRTQVAAAAQASTESLTRVVAPLQTAIEDLRRTQYQQQGEKQQVVETRSASTLNINYVGVAIAIVGVILVIIGIFLSFSASNKGSNSPQPQPTVTVTK